MILWFLFYISYIFISILTLIMIFLKVETKNRKKQVKYDKEETRFKLKKIAVLYVLWPLEPPVGPECLCFTLI